MTLADERYRSIESTRDFLSDLLDSTKTPRVPLDIRERALRCLRHFPHDYEMQKVAARNPLIFEDPNENPYTMPVAQRKNRKLSKTKG